ncbi:hypothetical protein HDU96_009876 [Phlyctochytrium bullatum]|nr:hypothetical protein HDU96_009876 [Phlyctochytrium bullatum]
MFTHPKLDYLHRLAKEEGDSEACLALGQLLMTFPDNRGRDVASAVRYFEDAASLGMVEGAKSAAMIYYEGSEPDVPKSGKMARKWMRVAAELGYVTGWGILGDWYWASAENGKDDDDDPEFTVDSLDSSKSAQMTPTQRAKAVAELYRQEAFDAWHHGAETEDLHCLNRLGDHFATIGKLEKASAAWERATAKGDVKAAKSLVKVHEMKRAAGELDQKVPAKKAKIRTKDSDDPHSSDDDQVPDSPRTIARKYIKYSEIASSSGDPSYISQFASLNHVGVTANNEVVLPRDPPRALDLYMKAHKAGAPSSSSLMAAAHILMSGDAGIPANRVQALELFVVAAREGSAASLVAVGDAYMEGVEGPPDYIRAVSLYMEAEKMDDPTAAWKLGDCYREGLGCERDLDEAFRLYNSAAEKKDFHAMRRVAQCYWEGLGCEVNEEEAERWMKAAQVCEEQP